jgi:hypothetical protein
MASTPAWTNSSGISDLTVPCVPTGRKAGVEKNPWAVSILPNRPLEKRSFLRISNLSAITCTNLEIRISESEGNLDRESGHQEIRVQDIREPGHQEK